MELLLQGIPVVFSVGQYVGHENECGANHVLGRGALVGLRHAAVKACCLPVLRTEYS
jgi:hypothetical protein